MHVGQRPRHLAPEPHHIADRNTPVPATHISEIVAQRSARQELQDQVLSALEDSRVMQSHDVIVAAGQAQNLYLALRTRWVRSRGLSFDQRQRHLALNVGIKSQVGALAITLPEKLGDSVPARERHPSCHIRDRCCCRLGYVRHQWVLQGSQVYCRLSLAAWRGKRSNKHGCARARQEGQRILIALLHPDPVVTSSASTLGCRTRPVLVMASNSR